jgi:hypothetical protein
MAKRINSTLDEGQTPVVIGGHFDESNKQPIGLDEEQNAMVNRFGTLKARMEGGGFEGAVMVPQVSGTLGGGSGQRGWSNDLDRSGAFVPVNLTSSSLHDICHPYADAKETDAVQVLRELRETVGAKAFVEWGLGVLASFFPQEVLRPAMHGAGIREQAIKGVDLVSYARQGASAYAERAMRALWEAGGAGCSSCRWRPHEQRAIKLAAYLQGLSQPGTQAEEVLCDMRLAAQRVGLLRTSLSAVQEVGRPVDGEGQSVCSCQARRRSESEEELRCLRVFSAISRQGNVRNASSADAAADAVVRRLSPVECEFLQSFPRTWTAWGISKDGKRVEMADSSRYRQLGNAVTVNVAQRIARRVMAAISSFSPVQSC